MTVAPVMSRLRTRKRLPNGSLGAGLALVTGAAVFLVALNSSNRETVTLPVMAERPVILLDGTALHVQRFEVTVAEWNECHDEGGCTLAVRPRPGKAAETTPATGLSHMSMSASMSPGSMIARGMIFACQPLPNGRQWLRLSCRMHRSQPSPIHRSTGRRRIL